MNQDILSKLSYVTTSIVTKFCPSMINVVKKGLKILKKCVASRKTQLETNLKAGKYISSALSISMMLASPHRQSMISMISISLKPCDLLTMDGARWMRIQSNTVGVKQISYLISQQFLRHEFLSLQCLMTRHQIPWFSLKILLQLPWMILPHEVYSRPQIR